MSAEIVNLRLARKAKVRTTRAEEASANRAKHGRSRAERDAVSLESARVTRRLDGHLREAAPDVGDGDRR